MAKKTGMTEAEVHLMTAHVGRDVSSKNFDDEQDINKYVEVTYLGKTFEEIFKDVTPREIAKDWVYYATGLEENSARIAYAKKALKIDPDCAPAYLLISHCIHGFKDKKYYLKKAAEAAKKILGDSFNDGTIGNSYDTTPYLTAQSSLADLLWIEKDFDGSLAILNELFNMNPSDPTGIHFSLLPRLLLRERFLEADRLIERFDNEKTAVILYSKAYIAFHKNSKTFTAAHTLKEAFMFNPYVPMFMLGFADLPDYDEDDERSFLSPGNPAEADDYLIEGEALWFSDKKVITWFVAEFARNKTDILRLIEQEGQLEEWDDPNVEELNQLEDAMSLRNYGELEEILRDIDPDKLEAILNDPDLDWDDDDFDLDDEDEEPAKKPAGKKSPGKNKRKK